MYEEAQNSAATTRSADAATVEAVAAVAVAESLDAGADADVGAEDSTSAPAAGVDAAVAATTAAVHWFEASPLPVDAEVDAGSDAVDVAHQASNSAFASEAACTRTAYAWD